MSRRNRRDFFCIFFSVENLFELLPLSISALLKDGVCELRLRTGRPLYAYDGAEWFFVGDGGKRYVASQADLDYVLGKASGYSMYAVTDNLVKGYIPWRGGIRIGVAGEGVTEGDRLHTLKNVSSLTIRVPREVRGAADKVIRRVLVKRDFKNTLIISPTSAGKTTMLRELARLTSDAGLNVVIIDERFELSAPFKGLPTLDVGACTDIVAGVPKLTAYENIIRSMNPDVIITDEIYGEAEVEAVLDAIRAGVKVGASLHASDVCDLKGSVYEKLADAMEVLVILTKQTRAGEIKRITVKC